MFADNAQISHRQLFRQMVTGLLGIYFLVVPGISNLTGRQGVFCLLAGMAVYMLLFVYFIRIKHVFQNPEKYLGRITGKVFVVLYLSWLWLMGVYLLLVTARVTERFLIEGSISWTVIALAALGAYLGSHQGLERRGRMAEVCFPVLLIILAGMLLLGILKARPEYFWEIGSFSIQGFLEGTYQVMCLFLPFAFLPVTLGNVKKPGDAGKIMAGAAGLITGLLILALLLLQGSFGLGGYEHKDYPMFDLMAGIRLPGDFLERVDIFWIAAVMFGVLFGLGSVFFYNHELLVRIHMEKTAVFAAAGIAAAGEICEKLNVSEEIFLDITFRFYGPLFFILFIYAGFSAKRKHPAVRAALLCLCCLFLTGCGVALEDRVFPLSMSADYRAGHYSFIYGIPGLTHITGQTKEDTQESQAQAIVYEGRTPADTEENFNKNQKNYLDMGHIKTLILGEELLKNKEALSGFLDYLEDKPSVAGNIYVFFSKDVEELMSLDGEGQESVGDYLTGILENTLEGKEKQAVTLQDLYNAYHRNERRPDLLEVTVVNRKPQIRQYS